MKPREINIANKLIAEFMKLSKLSSSIYCFLDTQTGETLFLETKGLRYEEDWNWLMPVVKKISDMHDQLTYNIVGHIFDDITCNLYSTDIQAVYNNIIDFIKIFNNDTEDYFIEYKSLKSQKNNRSTENKQLGQSTII